MGFTTAAALVYELMEARDERRLLNLQRKLSRLNLLIIDELGFVPLSRTGAELLFEVFSSEHYWTRSPTTSTSWRCTARATPSSAAGRTPPRKLQRSQKTHNAPSTLPLPAPVTSPP